MSIFLLAEIDKLLLGQLTPQHLVVIHCPCHAGGHPDLLPHILPPSCHPTSRSHLLLPLFLLFPLHLAAHIDIGMQILLVMQPTL